MKFTQEQTNDIAYAIKYYQQHHISITSPRYEEYEVILKLLQLLNKTKDNMTVTTEDGGRQNMFAKEPPIRVQEVTVTHNERAELLNGRLAMLGVIAAIGAYVTTRQLIPGIF